MLPQKSHVVQTLIAIALIFYVFNSPASAGHTVNKALHSAGTFFSSIHPDKQ
ncbi:hypothetical protein [Actinomadura rupiterrae]|uniref:hypothetical protein n=1 Tax=Actinomadura rupiterrae TaxID=559627 RepID=UPI0020A50388|nr:hypothetical protein [Actinomadura rupiterrae]MCP2343378.1 hypothetical protein [Actinomadura rupiterrae]